MQNGFNPQDFQQWVTAVATCTIGVIVTLWAAIRPIWRAYREERAEDLKLREPTWQARHERLMERMAELERDYQDRERECEALRHRLTEILMGGSAILAAPPPAPPVSPSLPPPPPPEPPPSSSSGSP